jgi:peptidoglycan/xylan/chitin deacetylase (PgdA/CDA1 family)
VYRLQSALPVLLPNVQRRLSDHSAVAITIDDGPSGRQTEDVLRLLEQRDIRTTWFLSGAVVDRYPEQAAAIAAAGHAVAAHGYEHRSMVFLSAKAFLEDVRRSREAIAAATGILPTLYRPPYGRLLPRQISLLQSVDCRVVLWSRLPGDWDRSLPGTILQGRLSDVRGGDIVVLHDRPGEHARLTDHLEMLIRGMELRGLRATLLDKLKG